MATKSSLVGMTAPSILSTEFSESAPFNVLEDAKYQNAITLIVLQILRTVGIKFAIKRMKLRTLILLRRTFCTFLVVSWPFPIPCFRFLQHWFDVVFANKYRKCK